MHAADLRLLEEAKDRERTLWEREIDAALSHVKVRATPVGKYLFSENPIVKLRDSLSQMLLFAPAAILAALTPLNCRCKRKNSAVKRCAPKKDLSNFRRPTTPRSNRRALTKSA